MIYLAAVCLGTMLILDLALVTIVIRTATRLSHIADDVSKGNLEQPALPTRGNDEIAMLAGSFNRMYLSLEKAMQLLDNQA